MAAAPTIHTPEQAGVVAADRVIDQLKNHQGKEAAEKINKDFQDHKDDAAFLAAYRRQLQTKAPPWLPELVVGLDFHKKLPDAIPRDSNGAIDRNAFARSLAPGVRGTFTPAEQIGIEYLNAMRARMTFRHDRTSSTVRDDRGLTVGDVDAYVRNDDRDKETRLAQRILSDANAATAFRNYCTRDQDRDITKTDIQNRLNEANAALNTGDLTQNGRKRQEDLKEALETLQKNIKEFSRQNTLYDTVSIAQLTDWANRHRDAQLNLTGVNLAGDDPAVKRPGYMSDKICDYLRDHFGAMADGANDDGARGNRITLAGFKKFAETRKASTNFSPAEAQMLVEIEARFQLIANRSKSPSDHEGQININDISKYRGDMASERASKTDDMETARKAIAFFRDRDGNFNLQGIDKKASGKIYKEDLDEWKKSSEGSKRTLEAQLRVEETVLRGDPGNKSQETRVKALRDQVTAFDDQMKIADYLKNKWDSIWGQRLSDGSRYHTRLVGTSEVSSEQLRNFIAQQGGALEYVDSAGKPSTPEAEAAARRGAPARETAAREAAAREAAARETAAREAAARETAARETAAREAAAREAAAREAAAREAAAREAAAREAAARETAAREAAARRQRERPNEKTAAEEWAEGLRFGRQNNWGEAEAHLRQAQLKRIPCTGKDDRVGNGFKVDLAEAILKNPANAGNATKRDEAQALLRQASECLQLDPARRRVIHDNLIVPKRPDARETTDRPNGPPTTDRTSGPPKAGYVPDLMKDFVNNHWAALSAGAAGVSRASLDQYARDNARTTNPQEKAVMAQMQVRFDQLKDTTSGLITRASIDKYATDQAAARKDAETSARVARALTPDLFKRLAGDPEATVLNREDLADAVKYNRRFLMERSLSPAVRDAHRLELEAAKFLYDNYNTLPIPLRLDQLPTIKVALEAKAAPARDYRSADGNPSSPEAEAARTRSSAEASARTVAARAAEAARLDAAFSTLPPKAQERINKAVSEEGSALNFGEQAQLRRAFTALETGNLRALGKMVSYGSAEVSPKIQKPFENAMAKLGIDAKFEATAAEGSYSGSLTLALRGSSEKIRLKYQSEGLPYTQEVLSGGASSIDVARGTRILAAIKAKLVEADAPARPNPYEWPREERPRVRRNDATETTLSPEQRWIKERITDEGGFVGFRNYQAALARAASLRQQVIISSNQAEAARQVLDKHHVVIYLPVSEVERLPNTAFGNYFKTRFRNGSSIAYWVPFRGADGRLRMQESR